MPKKQRKLSVSPGHNNHSVGSCSACIYSLNVFSHMERLERRDVWLIRLAGTSFCLCDDCLDEMEKQIHQQKARRKVSGRNGEERVQATVPY